MYVFELNNSSKWIIKEFNVPTAIMIVLVYTQLSLFLFFQINFKLLKNIIIYRFNYCSL